ncbi:MAG: TraB/GumN family protein [Parvularculaceae bacterium]
MTFKSSLRRGAAIAAAALLGACGADGTNAASSVDAAEAGSAPAMWRGADEDTEVFLFGTFHILPKDIEWTTAGFDVAMAATEHTLTEADVTSPQAQQELNELVAQYGLNPPGVTLSDILGPDRAARLAETAEGLGINPANLESQRPWLALLTLAVVAMQKAGYDPASGAERIVEARAKSEGDDIGYLEDAEVQVKALASLDADDALANFDAAFEQFEEFAAYTSTMLTAWRTGDVETLDQAILADLRRDAPTAFDALIVSRNRAWTRTINGFLEGEGGYFIAVGAGHLVGEESVLNMLKAEGWRVERVQ